jgi:phage tail tube protein FII
MVFNKELKIIITSASNSVIKKKPTAMAKTSNRQETFNDKAHDQKKLRAEETRQTESSSPHTNTTNIDTGTAKEEEKNSEKMRNTQQEAERNTLKQTPNCIRLGPAIFFGP